MTIRPGLDPVGMYFFCDDILFLCLSSTRDVYSFENEDGKSLKKKSFRFSWTHILWYY